MTTRPSYVWDGSQWVPLGTAPSASQASRTVVSTTPPANPVSGDMWFESDSTRFFIYYDNYWVEASSPVAAVGLLDGGEPGSTYGGITPIDAGGVA